MHYKKHIYLKHNQGVCFDFYPQYFTDPTGHPSVCTVTTEESKNRGCSYKISFNINMVNDRPAQVVLKWLRDDRYSLTGDVSYVQDHEISSGVYCQAKGKLTQVSE